MDYTKAIETYKESLIEAKSLLIDKDKARLNHILELEILEADFNIIWNSENKKHLSDFCYDLIKISTHQNHISVDTTEKTAKILSDNIENMVFGSAYSIFELLYNQTNELIGAIHGIGPITIYDIALRLGYLRSPHLLPEKKIYLEGGACIAAKEYLKNESIPTKFKHIMDIETFDKLLSLPNYKIEDFLCVYSKVSKVQGEDQKPFGNYSIKGLICGMPKLYHSQFYRRNKARMNEIIKNIK